MVPLGPLRLLAYLPAAQGACSAVRNLEHYSFRQTRQGRHSHLLACLQTVPLVVQRELGLQTKAYVA